MTYLLRIFIVILSFPLCLGFYALGLIASIFFIIEGTFGSLYRISIGEDTDECIDTLKVAVVLIFGIFIFPYEYIVKGKPLFDDNY